MTLVIVAVLLVAALVAVLLVVVVATPVVAVLPGATLVAAVLLAAPLVETVSQAIKITSAGHPDELDLKLISINCHYSRRSSRLPVQRRGGGEGYRSVLHGKHCPFPTV